MKLFSLILMTTLSANLFASQMIDTYYQPKYEIVSVKPICPANPGGIRCMAIGTIVKLKATLNGCLDKVEFFTTQQVTEGKTVEIIATTVAKSDKRNATVRCVKIPESFQTIMLPREDYTKIELTNLTIEN